MYEQPEFRWNFGLDITPTFRLGMGQGLTYNKGKKNHFAGLVVGIDGMSVEKSVSVFDQMSDEVTDPTLPDAVFNVKKGHVLFRVKGNKLVGPGAEYDGWMVVNVGKDVLPIFALYLTSILRNMQLREGDASVLLTSVINDHMTRGK